MKKAEPFTLPSACSRRTLLKGLAGVVAVASLGELTACGVGNGATPVTFPALQGSTLTLPFASFPALKTAGGSALGVPDGTSTPILVVATGNGGFAALNALCTHQGCVVDYAPANDDVECGCHGSTFTLGGAVTQGPARQALPKYAAVGDANGVTITVT